MPQSISYGRVIRRAFFPQFYYSLILGLLLVLYFSERGNSQPTSDSLTLGPLQVNATRIVAPAAQQPIYINLIDSTTLKWASGRSVDELLSSHSTVDIKNYGAGGASTVSQRGMETDQTQVLWNGMPLNFSPLGVTDFGLLEMDMFSGVEVAPGNMSSSYGARSIGGSINLESDLPADQISVSQSIGSFGYTRTMLKTGYSSSEWKVGLLARRHQADNDYSYIDPLTDTTATRENNGVLNRQIMAGIELDQSEGIDVKSLIWWNNSDHQVPGPVVAGTGSADQFDQSFRWLNIVETQWNGWRLTGKGYYSGSELDYRDENAGIDSKTFSWQTRLQLDARKPLSDDFLMQISGNAGLNGVRTNNYNDQKRRQIYSVQTNPVFEAFEDIYVYPAVRLDHYSDIGSTVSPSLGANWKADEELIVRLSAGYNFSPPTFNDLYWEPGGNPDLESERSKKLESGVRLGRKETWYGMHDITFYHLNLFNGIQWRQTGGNVWTPVNVKRMQSRGITWRFSRIHKIADYSIRWKQTVDWNQANITRSRFRGDQVVGNQLAYVPEWTYKTTLSLSYPDYYIALNYRWTGTRYTDNTRQNALDPYSTIDLNIGYHHRWGPIRWEGSLFVNNVTDTRYQVIQWYPMPGRHFRFSITLNYIN